MASSIESKKSRSKLGSLGGLRTEIISILEQPQRETRFGDKRSQEQGRGGNHEGRPGRKGRKAEAAAFFCDHTRILEISKPINKKYNFQLSGQPCHPLWVGWGSCCGGVCKR